MEAAEAASKPALIKKTRRKPKGTNMPTLDHIDKRTRAFKRVTQLAREITTDLGGADQLSTVQQGLVQKYAVMNAALEALAIQWLHGETEFDYAAYSTMVNTIRRLAETIGLRREARAVKSLDQLIKEINQSRPTTSPSSADQAVDQ